LAFIFFLSILLLLAIGSSKPGEEAFHPVKVGLLGQGEEGSLPYEGVLREEGFPWARLGEEVLKGSRVEDLVALYPALILPEGQALSEESFSLLKDYVEKGGQLLWIYDAGLHCEREKSFWPRWPGRSWRGKAVPMRDTGGSSRQRPPFSGGLPQEKPTKSGMSPAMDMGV